MTNTPRHLAANTVATKKGGRIEKALVVLVVAVIVAVGAAIAFARYADGAYPATDDALQTCAQRGSYVESPNPLTAWYTFGSTEGAACGLVFYPGALVSPEAYAPLVSQLADHGVFCVLVRMPANMAFLAPDEARDIREAYPQVHRWYLAGHSLGGAMGAGHVAADPDEWEGIVLLAAYSTADLSTSGLRALTLVGSLDTVVNRDNLRAYAPNLPADAMFENIEGGNHAGFGDYGPQSGDTAATIDAREQQRRSAEEILRLMGLA